MHKLFVYGTLMSPYGNHRLIEGSQYVGRGVVDGSLFGFGIPGISLTKHRDDPSVGVQGEVYIVDDDTLALCDRLEGHPDHYRRVEVKVTLDDHGDDTVWVYEYPNAHRRGVLIPSGDYRIYRDERGG